MSLKNHRGVSCRGNEGRSPVCKLIDSVPYYNTEHGSAVLGDSHNLLRELPDQCIDLVLTSPPFPLQHQKEYGNVRLESYNDWFLDFAQEVRRVLQPYGSFVVELGGTFDKGSPRRSTYQFELVQRLTNSNEGKFELAQDFYWYNPAKLPNPVEWVNIRKIRVTDAITHIWWLSKDINDQSAVGGSAHPIPEADNRRVLQGYSDYQKTLIKKKQINHGVRPSGWNIDKKSFTEDNGGAIPKNCIVAANTASNTHYLNMCRKLGFEPHPARFPNEIPNFFIKFLTPNPPYDTWEAGELDKPIVLDIFAGSNVTGRVAESMDRNWLAFEKEEKYLETSQFRFNKGDTSYESKKTDQQLLTDI